MCFLPFLLLFLLLLLLWPVLCARQAFPHGVLQPLPKRPALEKSNGSSSLFNPSVLHYQQALANAQLQQPAFFPTGEPTVYTNTHTHMHKGTHAQRENGRKGIDAVLQSAEVLGCHTSFMLQC